MKEPGKGIGAPLGRMNKRVYIVLICFLISAVFWLLIALSHDYPTALIFPVRYTNLPGKKVVMNDLPEKVSVQLKASGFKIMSLGFKKEQDPVTVDVSTSLQNRLITSDIFAIPTQSFLPDFSRQIGKDIQITGFDPDSIVFNFSDLTTKKVRVVPVYSASFDNQYDSTGAATVDPAEVEVSGPPALISELKEVYTQKVVFSNLKGAVKQKVKLEGNKLLSYNTDEVTVSLNVEKFTEGSVDVEIHPVNVTNGYSIKTFPDKVKVRYLVSLSHYNKVDVSMFDAVVDASEMERKKLSKLNVTLMTSPSFVRISLLEPAKVDYILRKQ